jgi:hypothetical protein
MEVRIGPRARAVLERNHTFTAELIEALANQNFAAICFIDEPSTAGMLEIKCLGGQEVVVPESAFNTPGVPRRIVNELATRIK